MILTGALDDGTEGLMYVKKSGGISIVQDPREAAVPEMPTSAIENVAIDYVLPLNEISPILAELAHKPSHLTEQKVLTKMADSSEIDDELRPKNLTGPPTTLGCPECKGPLWKTEEANLPRYTCHVGHSYSEATLVSAKSDELEMALWTALRTLKESAAMYRTIGQRARNAGRKISAEHFEQALQKVERQIETISSAMVSQKDSSTSDQTAAH